MPRDGTKLALFIDGANLHATAKALGFDIDYKRLLKEFQSRGNLVRAFYSTAIIEDQEFFSIRPLIDWLGYNGFTVITKPAREFDDGEGRRKFKRNMSVRGQCEGACQACRSDRVVFRVRRLLSTGRSRAAPRRPRHRGVHHEKPASDDRRRVAAPGRRLHRP
jgi:uncharacterized LabA/DUF88 family protein